MPPDLCPTATASAGSVQFGGKLQTVSSEHNGLCKWARESNPRFYNRNLRCKDYCAWKTVSLPPRLRWRDRQAASLPSRCRRYADRGVAPSA